MTIRPHSTRIPISALLPPPARAPSDAHAQAIPGPSTRLHPRSYILGALPSTSPIHLALEYLKLSDERPYHCPKAPPPAQRPPHDDGLSSHAEPADENDRAAEQWECRGKGKEKKTVSTSNDEEGEGGVRLLERVMLITGPKGGYMDAVIDEDEDRFRDQGGYLEVLKRLKRVDIRYCPTITHLKLLLSLLSESPERLPSKVDAHHTLAPAPTLVILWNVAGLMTVEHEVDENSPPRDMGIPPDFHEQGDGENHGHADGEEARGTSDSYGRTFKDGICISDYMDILAAAKATVDHLSALHPAKSPVQLVILEPSLGPDSSLPILPPLGSENEDPKMSRSNRERRINFIHAARRLLGSEAIGVVERDDGRHQGSEPRSTPICYTLRLEGSDQKFDMVKRRCEKALAARTAREDNTEVEGEEQGGWRWDWVSRSGPID